MKTAILLLLGAQAITAQENLVFHVDTREVIVNTKVTDKKGAFQRDLTRQNFKILEDGKPQPITSFSLDGPTGHARHFIALVFEQDRVLLREEVAAFVDRYASPDLYFAVYSRVNSEMRLQQAFTTDAARIKAAIRAMPAMDFAAAINRPSNVQTPLFGRVSAVAADLAFIRGHKALILFSYGYTARRSPGTPPPPPLVAAERKVIDACNTANVSIYSFHTDRRRFETFGDFYERTEEGDRGAATDFIHDLATGTGGKYTPPTAYDLAAYLNTATNEQSDYYLLGFTPSAEPSDTNCHKLKVQVDRRGLNVDARDSYCTSAPLNAPSLSIGPLTFGTKDYALTGVTAELDNSMLEIPHRLAAKGRALIPMTGATFQTRQPGMVYFEISTPPTGARPTFEIRILDRASEVEETNTGPMDTKVWIQPGNPVIPILLAFPVSALPAGAYTLEVRATQGNEPVVARANFDVKDAAK